MSAVDDLINDARNYAVTVTAAGASAMAGATAALDQLGRGYISPPLPAVNVNPPAVYNPTDVPIFTGAPFTVREFNGREPTLNNVGTLSIPSAPAPVPTIPVFVQPNKPAGQADTSLLNGIPTVNTNITAPTPPTIDVLGIPQPVIIPINLPTAPVYQPPQFTGTKPAAPPAAPTMNELKTLMQTEYSTMSVVMRDAVTTQIDTFIDHEFPEFRAGMATLEARLATYMAGGTALTPAVENAIYNRTLDKTNEDAKRAQQAAWSKAAKAGYTMPSAMLLSQQIDIDQERRNNNARAATDIGIKIAEMEQQNLQFAVEQSSTLRKVAIDAGLQYYSGLIQLNGQAIEYARSVIDAVVKAYDLAARVAEAQIRIYEADMRRYEMDLKGALATFEVYEQQVKGELAKAEVNNANVNAYRALLEAVGAQISVYRAQIDAMQGQIDIEKMKVDLYGSKVQAYVAQVNGFTAQWNGYEAAVRGEVAKISAAAEQVKAFGARVQAYEAQIRAQAVAIDAQASSNTQKITSYRAQVEAFSALTNAEATAVAANINSYDSTIKAYVAQANAVSAKSQAEITLYEVAQRGIQDAAKLQFEYMRERNSIDVARAAASGQIGASIGNIFARTAQAALAGMNTLASKTETITS